MNCPHCQARFGFQTALDIKDNQLVSTDCSFIAAVVACPECEGDVEFYYGKPEIAKFSGKKED